jgi:Arc/MetJ-type ribon-helix-helix transcriptional regulator
VSSRAPKNHASVRLEPEILERVDALIPLFSTTGHPGTRSDAVRALIRSGLEHLNDAASSELAELDDDTKITGRVR